MTPELLTILKIHTLRTKFKNFENTIYLLLEKKCIVIDNTPLSHFLLDTQTAPNYKKVKDLLENIIHFIHKSGTILRSGKILCPLELVSEFGAKRRVTRIQLLDYILPQVRLLD